MATFIIPTVFTAVDRLSGPVMGMQKAMVGFTTIAGVQGAKLQRSLQATSMAAMEVASSAAMIAAGIVIPLGLATKAAVDFEQQMTNVSTLVNTTKENMQDMGDAVLALAAKMPVKIADLTESLYQIRSAGISASKAMETLEASAKLSVAGLGTSVEATNMVTSALNTFKKESLDANTIADVLFKTVQGGKTKVALLSMEFGKAALAASDVGVTFRELMAMTAAMTNTGVQTAEAQTAITQSMISLNRRTSEMIDLQEKLSGQKGLTGMEFIKYAGGAVNAMEMVDKYAQSHRMDIFKIYGRKEAALADIALTRNQHDKYRELFETMQGGNAIQDAYQKQLGTTAAQAQIAKNNLVTLGIRIGDLLLPALTAMLKAVTPVIQGITDFARHHRTLAKIVVVSAAAFGIFAATVAVGSFVIGTITKATWLWNAAIGAFNFVQGIALGLTGGMSGILLTSRLAMWGYTVATYAASAATGVFAGSLEKLMLAIFPIIAGLGLIIAYRKEIQKWANDSQLGSAWNDAIGDRSAQVETRERMYMKDPAKMRRNLETHPSSLDSTLRAQYDKIDKGQTLGDDNDLLIKENKFNQATQNNNYNSATDNSDAVSVLNKILDTLQGQNMNLNIKMDKSGNVVGAVPIKINQTGTIK